MFRFTFKHNICFIHQSGRAARPYFCLLKRHYRHKVYHSYLSFFTLLCSLNLYSVSSSAFFSNNPSFHYSSNHLFTFVGQPVLLSVSHALPSEVPSLIPSTLTYISELMTYIHKCGLPSLSTATSLSPLLFYHPLSPSSILVSF